MQLQTIESRALHAIGYDAEKRVLEVVFNSGRIYQFVNVPPEAYAALAAAPSKGGYFNANLREVYPYWSLHAAREQRTRIRRRRIG